MIADDKPIQIAVTKDLGLSVSDIKPSAEALEATITLQYKINHQNKIK